MKKRAEIFVFSGTGNSLVLAQEIHNEMLKNGWEASLYPMEKGYCSSEPESLLGLVLPVAWFSTYPTALNFIETLPEVKGRRVFLAASMGGFALGMEGPVKKLLLQKGYTPLGAQAFIMPSNYNNKSMPLEENRHRMEQALSQARNFTQDIMNGVGRWDNGIPLVSAFLHRWSKSRRPWSIFYKMFPLAVDASHCTRCGLCVRLCPVGAVAEKNGYLEISPERCDSCQRCVGFCPAGAISVPQKPAVPYAALPCAGFQKFLNGSGEEL